MKKNRRSKPGHSPSSRRKPSSPPRRISPRFLALSGAALALLGVLGFLAFDFLKPQKTPVHGFRIVQRFPHAPDAFTQGLLFYEGVLYESTGLEGKSSVRRVDLETGEVLALRSLEPPLFGEGLALWEDKLIQLTWRDGVAFVYDKKTLEKIGEFSYEGEGWGLTHDGKHLIMSDGSSRLRFLDPATFQTVKTLPVRDGEKPIPLLNELEYIKGEIYANIWLSDRIACISPKTGKVTRWINLEGLLQIEPGERVKVDVLNGIAWDEKGKRLFVTGKWWPWLYHIELE